jgi:GT2 family glycosyltransferase
MNEPDKQSLAATVVIASRGRPEMLLETVRSVLSVRRVPSEIVIADQSSDPHPQLARMGSVRGCDVRYVHSQGQGLSRGRNVGLRLASQEVVVIIDDDMIAQEDSFELLLAGQRGGARTVATGRLLAAPPERPNLTQAPAALVTRTEPEVFRGPQPRQVVPGPNIAVPRSVLLEIGGYDERLGPGTRFPGAEDHDLSLRLLDAGCEVRHVPEAVVLHRAWRARRDLVRLRWGYARGMGGFYAKHASVHNRHTLGRAAHDVRTRLAQALTSVTSSPATTAAELLTLAGLLFGAVEWTMRYRFRRRVTSAAT